MVAIRCTKKVIEQFRARPEDLHDPPAPDAALGHWYANVIQLSRKKTMLFMSERTLLSFVLTGIRRDNSKDLPKLFIHGLVQLLGLEGFSTAEIERAMPKDGVVAMAKTANRKSLGNLNDLAGYYEHSVAYEGGLEQCDLWGIMLKANRMPQRNLNWAYAIDTAREMVRGDAT